MKRTISLLAAVLLTLAAAPTVAAGPMGAAERIVLNGKPDQNVQPCQTCHGKNGRSSAPTFPHLAGQYRSYMVQALKDYRAGRRQDPIMTGQAQGLTPGEIEALAAYFATRSAVLTTLPLD